MKAGRLLAEVRKTFVESAALQHRLAVVRVGDLRALLDPVLLQHRAVGDVDAVAERRARRLRVGDDRVAQAAEGVAPRLQVGDPAEFRRRGS